VSEYELINAAVRR